MFPSLSLAFGLGRQHLPFTSYTATRLISAAMATSPYETWSREDLIARLRQLDSQHSGIESQTSDLTRRRPNAKASRRFDISLYPRRKIALKFCYSGWEYNGLVFQSDKTRLPTVEQTLYNALAECKLIDGFAGPQACGWERCGRTDVGVSSAAQVVSLWVRSNIGQDEGSSSSPPSQKQIESSSGVVENVQDITDSDFPPDSEYDLPLPQLDASEIQYTPPPTILQQTEQKQELRYLTILNRILPSSIRIIAWSPISTSFSARFNCLQRHYKYFFSPEGLDLDAMRDAAARLVGEHDFRNLCKLDPAKQITIFRRTILRADISYTSVLGDDDDTIRGRRPHMCVLDLVGNAFLYNQVRHIMSILLLVGAGLEPPSVMTALLNADPERPEPPFYKDEPVPELVASKPEYPMADPLPLVLWECSYDEKDVQWQTDSFDREDIAEANSLYHQMSSIHTRSLIHAALDAAFLQAASQFHSPPSSHIPLDPSSRDQFLRKNPSSILNVPIGGGVSRKTAARNYVPLLRRRRLDPVEVVNERWRKGKGERRAARLAEAADVEDE